MEVLNKSLRQALMVQQWLKTDSCPKVFFKKAVLENVLIFKEEHLQWRPVWKM